MRWQLWIIPGAEVCLLQGLVKIEGFPPDTFWLALMRTISVKKKIKCLNTQNSLHAPPTYVIFYKVSEWWLSGVCVTQRTVFVVSYYLLFIISSCSMCENAFTTLWPSQENLSVFLAWSQSCYYHECCNNKREKSVNPSPKDAGFRKEVLQDSDNMWDPSLWPTTNTSLFCLTVFCYHSVKAEC